MDTRGIDWRIVVRPILHPDAARLVAEVQLEYTALYGTPDETPLGADYFEPPGGAFFVGYLHDEPVATGAWRLRSDVEALGSSSTAEIKRMYVVPAGRRRGLAREMLAHLEETAAAAGAEVMILESGSEQPHALALYADAGYEPIPGYGFYRDSPLNRCMARPLVSS
ncbi:MAG TPA: GNAT family N-acetyltransferase [Marmoricola sp.]|jgi:GNAT superfamily N-acetyltransferase|nr:GNAT family N-acetyltransferase [Marmoricola sp.]